MKWPVEAIVRPSARIPSVRKFLLALLIMMLPVQYSWAAVSAYCSHEDAATAKAHFGHHVHKHVSNAGGDGHSKPTSSHTDCHFCHLNWSMAFDSTAIIAFAMPALVMARDQVLTPHYIPSRPERPNWAAVA